MTALAVYLKQAGYQVTGSDVADEFATDTILQQYKIPARIGFREENIDKKYDLVVVTGAHGGMTNIEARRALALDLPLYMHGSFLGKIFNQKEGIAVAGCHGKTTTSALIASLLTHADFRPSYAVGVARINDLGAAGHFGAGKFFVAEADEYMTCPLTDKTPRFLYLFPKILVITNIEYDHPDAYADINAVKNAFVSLTYNLPENGIVVACIDSKNVRDILPGVKRTVITYGFSPRADFQISKFYFGDGASFMRIRHQQVDLDEFMLKIAGKHNFLNATASIIVANHLGVSWEKIRESLIMFTGTTRRFEKIAQVDKVMLYDDYAHHPSEIVATIAAARAWFPKRRLIVIFQPHTYSRTKALLSDFAKSFEFADIALIADIYPSAREQFDSTISAKHLVLAANKRKNNTHFCANKNDVTLYLKEHLASNDLVMTMGAGDIFLWHKDIIKTMQSSLHER